MKNTFTEYGPGYLEFDFCEISEPDIVIQSGQDIVWAGTRYLRSNVVVENGARLTIRCLLGMPQGSIITVEQGGTLIVDEGEITNLCGGTWQGIEVLGNPNTHQYGAGQQGVAELKNNAKVEYAEMGVSLFGRGNPWQTTGGILRVNGAEFTDNRWSVVFYNYAYLLNGVELSNRSYVNDATFNLTEQYPFDAFFAHAYVGFVNGVNFRDCTFDDERPAAQLDDDSKLARGLRSEGARFNAIGCQFSNLLYGIDALGFGETRNFSAKDCVFTDCYVGLSMRGVDNAQATESFFTIGGYNRPVDSGIDNPSLHSGIFIDRSSGFAIEKNTFEQQAAAVNTTIGITAQDTNLPEGKEGQHLDYNEIYNNTFSGLAIGNLANGNNMGGGDGAGGLTYLCNKNTNTPFSNDIRVDDGAVAARQIDLSNVAAGNVFTSCEEGLTHIDNLLGNSIRYYFWDQGTNEEPVCSPAFRVTRIEEDRNECSDGGDIPAEKINIHLQLFDSLKLVFLERHIYYKGLLDNGSSEEVLSLIESTTPANSESRKEQLLSYSPYLSKASALAVVGQQNFTSSQKKDILAANPELLYRDAVWNAILADSSFSQQQLSELEQARETSTSRDSLEREMAEAYGSLHRAGNKLVQHYQSDTAGVVLDTIQSLLSGKLSLEAAYQKADAFLQARDTASALQELAAIPESYDLSPAQLKEHGYYFQLKQLQAALVANGQAWQDIAEPEKSILQAVVDNSLGRAAVQAENILMAVDGGNKYYRSPIITTGEQPRAQPPAGQEESTALSRQRLVQAFPNPARETVHFRYRIPEGSEGASLSLFNPAGRQLAAFRLADTNNQLSWKTGTLPAGLYYYRLLLPNGQSETGKFAVLK
ncbi:MAG: T9SS type A sorting domain-containing protein [Lewinellaceae bacterium]|nr:T9SS type A sorting domain-containing protein [Lewinellaceae bacterium]